MGEAIEPTRRQLQQPDFTAGWDVIDRGDLGSHPVYQRYLGLVRALFGLIGLGTPEPPTGSTPEDLCQYALADLPILDPRVVFAFPGQPEYRHLLGKYVPPPRVEFTEFTWHAKMHPGAEAMAKLAKLAGAESPLDPKLTFQAVMDDLDSRIKRFRSAAHAISIGLPADAFELRDKPPLT